MSIKSGESYFKRWIRSIYTECHTLDVWDIYIPNQAFLTRNTPASASLVLSKKAPYLASGWDPLRPNIDVQAEGKAVAAGGQVSGAVCVDSDGVRWDRGWEGTVRGTLSSHRNHERPAGYQKLVGQQHDD